MIFAPHAVDFYKPGHIAQYPEGLQTLYSNLTPRSARLAKKSVLADFDNKVVSFGFHGIAQWLLRDLWNDTFFSRPKEEVIEKIRRRMDGSLGEGTVSVSQFEALHDLGYLPVHVKAIREGNRVNIGVPLMTISNTEPGFGWLTNYLETQLSNSLWEGITIATIANEYRILLERYALKTGAPLEFVPWQGHDFSYRGVSLFSGGHANAGHLLSFTGTDTIPAIDFLEDYYDGRNTFVGGSVPATEHSVMCAGGEDGEVETYRRLITKVRPSGVISIVSDTWDFWNVVTNTARELKEEILSRVPDSQGMAKVVFRPDSGNPADIICGSAQVIDIEAENIDEAGLVAVDILRDRVCRETAHGECGDDEAEGLFRFSGQIYLAKIDIEWNRYDKQYYYEDGTYLESFEPVELTPAEKGAVECLWEIFGGDTNELGYRTLNQRVGLIYGDSITLERAEDILSRLEAKGFSSANIVFGIGSFSYRYITRDTFGTAMKATYAVVNGEGRNLFKDPKTDNGTKRSAKGLLRVSYGTSKDNYQEKEYFLLQEQSIMEEKGGELVPIFVDGKVRSTERLSIIRERLTQSNQRRIHAGI